MYISRATLRDDIGASGLAALLPRDSYSSHQLVWRLFDSSPTQQRDFIYRQEVTRQVEFYLVSERPPADDQGRWVVETKSYKPQLAEGDRLAFQLRANPVRSTRDDTGRVKRHDVVMDLKTQIKGSEDDHEELPLPMVAQQAGSRWLAERAGRHGFAVDPQQLRVDGYRQHRLRKRGKKSRIQFSTLDYSGILAVTDPQLFQQALFRGIGPAKGFGCGLLMVKRV